jgi:hypothetical protein
VTARAQNRARADQPAARTLPVARTLGAALAWAAVGVAAACSGPAAASGHQARPAPPVRGLTARPAPAGWHHAVLPGGRAVLAYPPAMHLITGDRGTVTAARISRSGSYLLYLNATPRQGAESLRNWARLRVNHLRDEDASAARLLAASRGLRFTGATGSCVLDTYVTKIKAHHYTELACLVQGHGSASVIVAAAPAADWSRAAPVLTRAVGAYRAR